MRLPVIFFSFSLFIDDKLKYDYHIKHVCSRLSSTAGITYSIQDKLTIEAAQSLYYSLARLVISYLLLFWGLMFGSYFDKVQVLQNKIVHNLFSQKLQQNTSTTSLFYNLKILKVKELYLHELGIVMYKAIYFNCYDALRDTLRELNWTHNYNTHKINAYRLPAIKTSNNARHIIFKREQFWNNLPLELRSSNNFTTFTCLLKDFLLSRYV